MKTGEIARWAKVGVAAVAASFILSVSARNAFAQNNPLTEGKRADTTKPVRAYFAQLEGKSFVEFLENHTAYQYRDGLVEALDSLHARGFRQLYLERLSPDYNQVLRIYLRTGDMDAGLEEELRRLAHSYEYRDTTSDERSYLRIVEKVRGLGGWEIVGIRDDNGDMFDSACTDGSVSCHNLRVAKIINSKLGADSVKGKGIALFGMEHYRLASLIGNSARIFLYHAEAEKETMARRRKECAGRGEPYFDPVPEYVRSFLASEGGLWVLTPGDDVLSLKLNLKP